MTKEIYTTTRSLEEIISQARTNIAAFEEYSETTVGKFVLGYAIRDLIEVYHLLFQSDMVIGCGNCDKEFNGINRSVCPFCGV